MSEEPKYWGDELIERYPKIFSNSFYFECGEGWKEILDNACGLIQNHCDNLEARNNNQTNQVKAVQIKEKFGGLRFYTNIVDDYVRGVINMAEFMSYSTCETCGDKAFVFTPEEKEQRSTWEPILCEKHLIEYERTKRK